MVSGHTAMGYISRVKRLHLAGRIFAILLLLLGFSIVFPIKIEISSSYAADYGGPAGNPSTTSLNLTLTDDTLALDLVAGSTTGSFAASSPANFTVSTNNVSGYTLSIKSKVTDPNNATQVANASRLVNTDNSAEYISSIASSLAPATFSNSSNTQYNNQWGYLPSKLNSSSNSNYLPAPSYDTATILNTTACANGTSPCTSNTDSYSITLGARVNNTLSSGTYEHVFTIIALGNPINYSITYNANDGANGANTTNMPSPNPQTGNASVDTTSIALSSATPERQGKAFKGWCTVEPTIDPNTETDSCNNSTDGTGITYQPGADYGIDQTVTNIVDLYAMWGPALTVNFNGNGLYFNNNTTDVINTIDYDATSETVNYTEEYSHTTNLDDTGNKIGDANYSNNASANEVITIPGASTLHIKLTWGGESATYDWVSFWAGNYPSYTASSNYSTGVKCAGNTTGKYGGGSHTATSNTIECDITGDVVTFAFKSDSGGVGDGYGYYAIINGYDASGNIVTMQEEVYSKTIASGEYKTPATAAGPTNFLGWSEDATATTPTYADESGIISNLPYVNGEGPITLYAIWNPIYTITYVNNCSTFNTGCSSSTSANISTQEVILTNRPSTGTEATTLGANNKFTQTGYKIKSWNTTANGSGTDYAAGTTYTVPAGSGAGSGITLYAHWVPTYTIQYDGNSADNASTGMGVANATTGIKAVNHTNVAEGDTFDLFASNFKRTGYGFVGWSTDSDAWNKLTDNDTSNDAKIWGPNEVITAPAYNGTPITTLYAVWIPAEKDGNNNPVYLQSWSGCSAMTATTYSSSTGTLTVAKNTVTALTDKRDGMVYAVAKLVDGDCWMIENLRLDTAGTVGQNTIDSSVTNESLSQGYGGVFHGLANPETSNFSNVNTENSLYTTASGVTGKYQLTVDNSYSSYLNYLFPRYNNTNVTWNNNTSSATTPTNPSQNVTSAYAHTNYNNYVYSYGNYYTWAAAIANTTYYQNYHVNNSWPSNSDAADTSLCPTGWRLPKNNIYSSSIIGSFSNVNQQMGKNTSAQGSREWRMFPNNFIYSGRWQDSFANNRGSNGYYWTSSAGSVDNVYTLSLSNTSVAPGYNSNSKFIGNSVRCVIDKSYKIIYDGNGATAGSMYSDGQEVKHMELYDGSTLSLVAPNYKKDGYGFAGWSPSSNATIGGTDPIYGPNETITISSSVFDQYVDSRRRVTLYAVWVAKETNVTMQTFNATNYAAYNSAPIGTVIALEDTRDNDVYAVAKLADGKWWMIENLRLDAEDSRGTSNIAKAQGYGLSQTYGDFIGLADSEDNFAGSESSSTNPTDANSIYYAGTQSGTATIDILQEYYAAFRMPRYNNNNTNLNSGAKNSSGIDLVSSYNSNNDHVRWYGYGNYYSWPAAVANTGYYSSSLYTMSTSICPNGWQLPLGGASTGTLNGVLQDEAAITANRVGGFSYLDRKLGGTGQEQITSSVQSKKWRSFPNNYVLSGYFSNSSTSSRGSYAFYWTRSVGNYFASHMLQLDYGGVIPSPDQRVASKKNGFSVRCIAQ